MVESKFEQLGSMVFQDECDSLLFGQSDPSYVPRISTAVQDQLCNWNDE